jgi:glycosyltransferase involved in cell wall biosynthesis
MKEPTLKELNIIIATHVFATGPSQELEDYLKNKVKTLMFIGHPFSASKEQQSFYKVYLNGELRKERAGIALRSPELLAYSKDFIYTLLWTINARKNFDIFFGVDPLNSFAGIFLNKIKRTRKVILYTIDYVPKRFSNNFVNQIYHQIDSYCVNNSHQIWNLSSRMAEERTKKNVLKDDRQIVVPIGVNFDRIKRLPFKEINRKWIAYMGHLRKGQGLELIIETLPRVVKEIPDVKLLIIGTGELENSLKKRVAELGISKNVEFKGFIKDHKDVENMLTQCAVGLAIYEPSSDSITQYTDPSKPKQYMACGLPVIITAVPWVAEEIEKKHMGLVIKYNENALAEAVIKLLKDDKLYTESRENAINFASELNWDKIFDNALFKALKS